MCVYWCVCLCVCVCVCVRACMCVCTLRGFAAVSVGVGSHQEHLTLRETWQRCDLGQRSRGWRDTRPAPTTRTSINREEVKGWGKGREAAPALTTLVSAFMCSGYEIQIHWLMLLHMATMPLNSAAIQHRLPSVYHISSHHLLNTHKSASLTLNHNFAKARELVCIILTSCEELWVEVNDKGDVLFISIFYCCWLLIYVLQEFYEVIISRSLKRQDRLINHLMGLVQTFWRCGKSTDVKDKMNCGWILFSCKGARVPLVLLVTPLLFIQVKMYFVKKKRKKRPIIYLSSDRKEKKRKSRLEIRNWISSLLLSGGCGVQPKPSMGIQSELCSHGNRHISGLRCGKQIRQLEWSWKMSPSS